ncbi:hypothetical protein N5J23_18230 [Comamonas aquatica]|uniref:Uncharacterized protein n=1 Tax=Comamonas aquatica TaxID=225991 RepID=A0AA43AZA4_9BURK|nr:hypothetical protein [Comamonas aquatica]MDH1607696.1 hypothetical protein [Comamonas aquatica]MDH1619443.1 hypothetical protein [Comamonas aquatica]MDH2007434.1 hypothetical protein [Comamonas aquatica]
MAVLRRQPWHSHGWGLGSLASNWIYATAPRDTCNDRTGVQENNLLITGFGFRPEDEHIIANLNKAFNQGIFDNIFIYDVINPLKGSTVPHTWIDAQQQKLSTVLNSI